MLIIKDVAASKELGAKEMSAVRGGSNYNFVNIKDRKSGV